MIIIVYSSFSNSSSKCHLKFVAAIFWKLTGTKSNPMPTAPIPCKLAKSLDIYSAFRQDGHFSETGNGGTYHDLP